MQEWLTAVTDRLKRFLDQHSDTLRRSLFYAAMAIGLFIVLSFIFRNAIFSWYLDKKVKSFNRAYHAELSVGKARIRGISALEINNILLKPEQGDSLFQVQQAFASVNFWKLLFGRVALTNFQLNDARLNLVRKDSLTNYMFLLEKARKNRDTASETTHTDYAVRMQSLLDAVFDKIPNRLEIHNFTIINRNNDHLVIFGLDTLDIENRQFMAPIRIYEDSVHSRIMLAGKLDKEDRQAEFRLYSGDSKKVSIPFIDYKWKAMVRFDTASFTLAEGNSGSGITQVTGSSFIKGLEIRHERISSDIVEFKETGINYVFNIGSDYFELDSTTTVVLNRLSVNPYIRYQPHPTKQIALRLHKHDFPADELFSSLPPGLFTTIQGIKTRGNLNFELDFFVDLSLPDSLRFHVDLSPRKFGIVSYGSTNLGKLNESFEYTAYEKGEPVRTFIVGPENPGFMPLSQISPYLQVSVLNSEDGAFFGHRGFMPDAFRESIVTNIKARRFARGGSTISMQLVKNVFLNRNKTVARKLEEALIVWLIENYGLSTKERMYEVYLNIIEWGPLVYGANEAAHFYFNKDASRLTLAEAIFLASIIPRPKYFKYSFDENGQLRDYLQNFYGVISAKMLKKGQITQQDFDALRPTVDLKGPAKLMLRKDGGMVGDTVDGY
jgi:hypothetical protein